MRHLAPIIGALVAACELVTPAIDSLLTEYVSKTRATDWGLVNNCLVQVRNALALVEEEQCKNT